MTESYIVLPGNVRLETLVVALARLVGSPCRWARDSLETRWLEVKSSRILSSSPTSVLIQLECPAGLQVFRYDFESDYGDQTGRELGLGRPGPASRQLGHALCQFFGGDFFARPSDDPDLAVWSKSASENAPTDCGDPAWAALQQRLVSLLPLSPFVQEEVPDGGSDAL